MSADSLPISFGRYRLLERIGSGGMAEVFKARVDAAAGTEKVLCVKRLLPHLSNNSEFMSLFISEAKVALPLTHGNITQVFDFGEVDGVYYLAMEYVRGPNLAAILQRVAEADRLFDVEAALYVGSEVCRGLQYAHAYTDAAGKQVTVVHRDVTPHNILVSYDGVVKLTDLGIALAATKASTDRVVLRGKPCYLSPEQTQGHSGDPRSDIFSLGAVLYEALTGVRPFEAATEAETLERVRSLKVDAPSTLHPDVDAKIDCVILKAMAKDPAQRYQRAGDFQVDLSRELHRRAHDFTADSLANRVRELFAWELSAARAGDENAIRDRLLFQLSRAGVAVEGQGKGIATEGLLKMHTVAIARKGQRSSGVRLGWPWMAGAALAALVLIIAVVFAGLNRRHLEADSRIHTMRQATSLPASDPTEHLTPRSLRTASAATRDLSDDRDDADDHDDQRASAAAVPGRSTRHVPSSAVVSKRRQAAFINCNSWPWSVVYVNGRRIHGNTPLYRVKVAAGRQQLRFVNRELGLSKEVSVSLMPGQTRTVAVRLQPSGNTKASSQKTSSGDDET